VDGKNLAELYDAPPFEWDEVRERLEAGITQVPGSGGPDRHTHWLTSLNPDGSPHVNALGAIFRDGAFWFVTGRTSRKGRNVARDPRVALSISFGPYDLVVEGRAELVTDPEAVAACADYWRSREGWPCEVDESGTALTAPYSAQSAGRPPWHVYRIAPTSAHAVSSAEPYGAMRWTF
jgi:pyridoxine/pyridoxamine 5'-phosphate oxidase